MGQGSCLVDELRMFDYQHPPYSTHYPELPTIFSDHPGYPVGNVIVDNTYCHSGSPSSVRFMNVGEDQVRAGLSEIAGNGLGCKN